jgi:RNA polymerase sigma factor (sigma-70 family)
MFEKKVDLNPDTLSEHLAGNYDLLVRIAARLLADDNLRFIMEPVDLVQETTLKLMSAHGLHIHSHRGFIALFKRNMKQVLIDAARRVHASKREGQSVELDEAFFKAASMVTSLDLMALESALDEMAQSGAIGARKAGVVRNMLRGQTSPAQEAARLGLSERTVQRDIKAARLQLTQELCDG